MAQQVQRINVSLPAGQVERIRRLVREEPSVHASVSAFVASAVAARLEDANAHQLLLDVLRRADGSPDDDDRAWAEAAMGGAAVAAARRGTARDVA